MPTKLDVSALLLFYGVVVFITVFLFVVAISSQNIPIAALTVMYVFLAVFMGFRKVDYGSTSLNTIRIEEAPLKITQLLSETTNKGVLINQLIIKTVASRRMISQTDLYGELPIPNNMCPTKEMVRQYILGLEKEMIIRDVASEIGEGKKRAYVLTKHGEWCVSAIEKYYPEYYVSFLVKNVLKTRLRYKLPSYDSVKEIESESPQ